MENNNGGSSSFWKNNSRAVLPGRVSPKKDLRPPIMNKGSKDPQKFQFYQQEMNDAWDDGDDEFCIMSGISDSTKISKRVSNSAALNVIKTHKSNKSSKAIDESAKSSNSSLQKDDLGTLKFEEVCITSEENDRSKPDDYFDIEETHPTDSRPKYRQFHAYPGRPQLLKLTSKFSRDVENDSKLEKFVTLLDEPLLNLVELKELSWSGIPRKQRAVTWRLLSGYLPTSLERRNSVLERKRVDYHKLVEQYFHADKRDEAQQDTFRQIHIDVPRMNPHVPLFQQGLVQEMFERILYIWAIRHPASGYVQGINDLVTPFFIVFLQEALIDSDKELETCQIEELAIEKRNLIEADSFWCLSKFLDCIQDNYIFAQLGIQAKVNQLKELIQRIDGNLHQHLQIHGVDYLQFSFRWMNNLLTRELPLHCTIRLWDTYLAESDGFALFQLYVCAAFLLYWKKQLLEEKDFQGLMLLLQNLPTQNWADSHIGVLVAEAFRLKFTYADAPKHFEAWDCLFFRLYRSGLSKAKRLQYKQNQQRRQQRKHYMRKVLTYGRGVI